MRLAHLTLLAVALSLPVRALAGGTAQIETGSGKDATRATIEFDGAKVRMVTAINGQGEAPQGEMIFRDGKTYAVIRNEGTPMVMEMGGMMKMMGSMANQQANATTDAFDDVERYYGLTATGRAESVGGVRGEVYRLDYDTKSGQRKSEELVLGTQTAVREMSQSMLAFGTAMTTAMGIIEPEGSRQLQAELQRKNVGVLRFGQEYRVVSLSSTKPPASRFVLPAAPTEMPQLPAGVSLPGMGGSAGAQGAAGSELGAIFREKAGRQQERIEARSEGEADAATDRAVDKVLDKAFGKIFGGE